MIFLDKKKWLVVFKKKFQTLIRLPSNTFPKDIPFFVNFPLLWCTLFVLENSCVLIIMLKILSNYLFSLKVLYSCSMRDESNKEQLELVKKTCQGFEACQLDATRQYFGNDECPGTEDEKMALWLEYSCVGGTDRTTHPVQKTTK